MWQGCPGNTPRTCPAPGTLRTRCGIESCGSSPRVRRFRCVSHRLPHGLIPALPAVTVYPPETPLKPIHTIRSAIRRSEHPSFNPFAIAARSCIINIRRTNNPLPDKHCCHDPMTPPPSIRNLHPNKHIPLPPHKIILFKAHYEAYSQAGQRLAQCSGDRVLKIAANSGGFDMNCSSVAVRLNQLRSSCE